MDRLQHGDVLVCQVTSPSWAPLFPLAAAVVADGGGALSHAAIASREHGLPAVLGHRHRHLDAARRPAGPGRRHPRAGLRGELTSIDPHHHLWRTDHLGVLAMPDDGFWSIEYEARPDVDEFPATQKRWYAHALDCFGPERSMFDSNRPAEQDALFGGTATRVSGL